MDHSTARTTWEVIAVAIDEIYNRNASQLSFEELYRYAYNLVLHKHGALLYDGVSSKINQHLLDQVQILSEHPASSLLVDMAQTWNVRLCGCVPPPRVCCLSC
jgi:cullin 3